MTILRLPRKIVMFWSYSMAPGYPRKSPGVYESAFDLTQAAAMAASSSLLFRHPSLQLRVLDAERGSGYVATKLLQRGELLLEAGVKI